MTKRGRPRKATPMNFSYRLRLTENEKKQLKSYSEAHNIPISLIFREALNLYMKGEKKNDEKN